MGTEKEKSVFIGQQIFNKGVVTETKDRIKTARIILWIIGGVSILIAFFDPLLGRSMIITGLIFVGFGFLTYKKPLISVLIPLILLLLEYTFQVIIGGLSFLFTGIILKTLILTGLICAVVSIIKAEKTRKKSEYLKEQNYH